MELEGVVHNGVVVPADSAALPEGTRVRISPTSGEVSSMVQEVPDSILRSQRAFWRDLPELLQNVKNHGKWACYYGDERIGIGSHEQLIRACIRRGISDDAFHLDIIEAQSAPPWEDVEVGRSHPAAVEEPSQQA